MMDEETMLAINEHNLISFAADVGRTLDSFNRRQQELREARENPPKKRR